MSKVTVLLLLFLIVSCSNFENAPPYLVGGPVACCTEKPGAYRFAGIEFDFYNKSAVPVESFSVSCRVYRTEDGKNPLVISNTVTARFNAPVQPGEQKHLCISLDSRIIAIPQSSFLVDFFTVPEIVYSDGSIWTDSLCCFYTRSYR